MECHSLKMDSELDRFGGTEKALSTIWSNQEGRISSPAKDRLEQNQPFFMPFLEKKRSKSEKVFVRQNKKRWRTALELPTANRFKLTCAKKKIS
jgi:hypothetical protein